MWFIIYVRYANAIIWENSKHKRGSSPLILEGNEKFQTKIIGGAWAKN